MTDTHNAELIAAVKEHFEDEMEDIKHYRHLAHKAKMDGCDRLAKIFKGIENDEFTHAAYLRDYLIRKGIYDPEGAHKHLEEMWLDIIDE